jgi:hypothetical protein
MRSALAFLPRWDPREFIEQLVFADLGPAAISLSQLLIQEALFQLHSDWI